MKRNQHPPCAYLFLSNCLLSVIYPLVALLITASLTVAQTKSVAIAVEDDAAPWSRSDGSGYANDLVVAAFKAVGVVVELKVVPYARCKRMAMNAEVVGCFSTSPSSDLDGEIELAAKPLFTVKSGYFYNIKKSISSKSQQQLPAGTVVGTVIGYEYPKEFEQLKQQGTVVVEESPSEDVNLRKLAAGRIDLALLNFNEMKTAASLIKKAGVAGQVQTTFAAGMMNSYIGFSVKHPQGRWAREQFDKGFSRIIANGTHRRIRETWLRLSK